MTSDRDPARAVERMRWLAEVQDGPVSRAQLLACGFTNGRVGRLVSREWLVRLFPGVYAVAHRALTERGRLVAALLYTGPESALSHDTAGRLRELIDRSLSPIHVSCAAKCRAPAGIAIHRPKEFAWDMHAGLPVTTVEQTLVDIALRSSDWELRKALAQAEYHGRISAASLEAVMGKGKPGSAKLRAAICRHMPELTRTLSPLEDMLLLLCESHHIPLPQPNERVGKWRPDGVWHGAMVIVELDGGDAHSSPAQRRHDAERDMYYRKRGYLILRYTYWQIKRQGAAVAAELKATLATRSALLRSSAIEG